MGRRHWLWILLCVFLLCLAAGCKKYDEAGTPPPRGAAAPAPLSDRSTIGPQLTVFSWWTAGGEKDGLEELFRLFRENYPGVEIVNAAVGGGAGSNAKAVLKTRMMGGDPPDTFQVHGGVELLDTWVKPGMMEPITDVFEEEGWRDKFPTSIWDMITRDEQFYAVPTNIHRANVLWYNKKIFQQHNLTPPTGFPDFFAAAETLKKAGITPLALSSRDKWAVTHLFEPILLAMAGEEKYRKLFKGTLPWTDEAVIRALEHLAAMLLLVNPDHAALTWDQACGLLMEGKAAMTVMGDWAKGYFTANKWIPDKDFGAVAAFDPGGRFITVTDTFGLPRGAKNPGGTVAFLKVIGSVEGQKAFNLKKGSIPARVDVPMDDFDPIAKWAMNDFLTKPKLPSCAHGSAAPELFVTAMNDELTLFIDHRDPQKTAKALEAAADDAGMHKEK